MASKEIATFDPSESKFPVLWEEPGSGSSFAEIVEENLGDEGFDTSVLPRYKIPSGGMLMWQSSDETEDAVKELTGVVVYWGSGRTFWVKDMDDPTRSEDESAAPDCFSVDGKVGIGMYGKGGTLRKGAVDCASCPMNEYGSALKGAGKRCKEQRQVWMLFEGEVFPRQIVLPPTSIKPFKAYMQGLAIKMRPYHSVITKISLTAAKNSGNIKYAVANPQFVGSLDETEAVKAKEYGATIAHMLTQAAEARVQAASAAVEAGAPGADPSVNDPWAAGDGDVPLDDDSIPAHLQD